MIEGFSTGIGSQTCEEVHVKICQQLVLPEECCKVVLQLAHCIPMAAHLGITKTKDRILQLYYWPGIFKNMASYCKACVQCHKNRPQPPTRAEMIAMPLMTQPFQRIVMDIIGLLPHPQRDNRFNLTIFDYATRYPEALALSSIEATCIARKLISVFARMGVPEEILLDQGTNFMTALLEEIYHLLQIKQIRTTPRNWDDYLPYLLFHYQEFQQESTGFSPFELLYGQRVCGPLDILNEPWTGESGAKVPVAAYVVKMCDSLQEMSALVRDTSQQAQR